MSRAVAIGTFVFAIRQSGILRPLQVNFPSFAEQAHIRKENSVAPAGMDPRAIAKLWENTIAVVFFHVRKTSLRHAKIEFVKFYLLPI